MSTEGLPRYSATGHQAPDAPGRWPVVPRGAWRALAAVVALGVLVAATLTAGDDGSTLTRDGQVTLVVFVVAVWAWIATPVDDTYVALGAAVSLVIAGVLSTEAFFVTLGDETIWLLLGAFVIAASVTSSGLATRGAAYVVVAARSSRQLAHLATAALVVTTFAVPSTSGRAALALPVFVALAHVLRNRPAQVRALALLFPTVILLSAVGSLLGAGAHLVTSQVLLTATGDGIDFVEWLLLGLPLAMVSSHLAAELVWWLFLRRDERRAPVRLTLADLQDPERAPLTGPLSVAESRSAMLLAVVVVLWCTEPLHQVAPAVVALLGALVATSPRYGSTTLPATLRSAPWSLLLFLAATLALGSALTSSGAADWLAGGLFAGFSGDTAATTFLVVVVLVSTAMHLLVQSRSARSSVLVPIVVGIAPTVGADPAAVAFASTAAAGFCHTLPSSAKPVAIFSDVDGVETFAPRDLLRLSALLAPLSAGLVLAFALGVWPHLGLPLVP